MEYANLTATQPPAGLYIIRHYLPSGVSEDGWQAARRMSKYGIRANHWSVYVRGWFFDITSELAKDHGAYFASSFRPRVTFRARRDTDYADGRTDLPRYWGIRVGTTDLPMWMLHEIGRRIEAAMGTYSFSSRNCHHFTTSFILCALQPDSLLGLRTYEPVCTFTRLRSQLEFDAWDQRARERAERGEKARVWPQNFSIPYLIEIRLLRSLLARKERDYCAISEMYVFVFWTCWAA
ncbi:hypothetical protein WOLCODRAFT_154018 [Wolfiporia cocos MD-104 SS10]|uniref:DUF862-domain-containing protein n=1 Tax=Wolfiporia cocos (strain MD-104) TaxID=742152 RepID=A0A2H3K6A8_WOLCO|nr:hypothetical protein WOLCODRAFT_154018 [Wolfiporia cocos MD-104 SS10]